MPCAAVRTAESDTPWLRNRLRHQDAERGDDRLVFPEDRSGHRDYDLFLMATVDGQPLPSDLSQRTAQGGRMNQHVVRLAVHRAGKELFLHVAGREGKQHQANAG